MRIVYFYQYFGTSKGGWSTRVYEMCRRWVAEGHKVTVVTTPYDKSDIPRKKGIVYRLDYEGIEVIVINFPQSNKNPVFKRVLDFFKYLLVALYYGFKLSYDIAVCSSGPITVGLVGIICCTLRRKKFVFEVRDLWPAGAIQLGILKSKSVIKIAQWFEKKCYYKADLIVAASKGMHDDIYARYKRPNIIVVPNACDNELFQDATPAILPAHLQNKKLILYTGSLGKIDHCMEIMHASKLLDTVKYPDLQIVIIGEGVDRAEMEAYKMQHGLDHVTFTGLIPKTEVAGWYKHAMASILTIKDIPMLHTASPNKIFDSFAAGVPIIQTTQGWIKELVEDSNCGITVPPNNPESLAAAFLAYTNSAELQAIHAANSLKLAETTFSRDRCAADMLAAMKHLVDAEMLRKSGESEPSLGVAAANSLKLQKVTFVVDWYTPSSHASSLRIRPWVDALQKTGLYDISIFTDRVSKNEKGVRTNFFNSPDNRTRHLLRLVQEFLLGAEIFSRICFSGKRIVVISSPPFIVACFAALACYISRKPYVFDVRDLYPLVYSNSGFIRKKSIAFGMLQRVAIKCYRNAVFTSTVTPQLVEYIRDVASVANVHLIKNGYNGSLFIPSEEKYEDFTLVFHGNIGQFQNPSLLVQVVEELNKRNEKIHCIAIGSGSKQKVFEKHPVENLEYLGRLNNVDLAAIIRKAHVGISFRTKDEISARSIPVRVSEYIGIAIPTVLTPKSEGGDLLETYQVGKSFTNEDLQEICDFIVSLKYNKDLYSLYKNNALRIRSNFSRENGAMLFVKNMQEYLDMQVVSAKSV